MLRDTGLGALDLFMIGAASGIMIGCFNYSGIGFTLSLMLIKLAAGSLIGLLVLAAIANIILGAGLPTVGCYILLAALSIIDPNGDRPDGRAHVHSLLWLPVDDYAAGGGRGVCCRESGECRSYGSRDVTKTIGVRRRQIRSSLLAVGRDRSHVSRAMQRYQENSPGPPGLSLCLSGRNSEDNFYLSQGPTRMVR